MLDEIVVTANRGGQTLFEQVQPATLLIGQDLILKSEPTLGETLANEPGVSSTYFGPGASRPIIRGLGDDRVRVLENGISVVDVSNVSPDHAVAADPLTYTSVEVVRGPATLLYGPNTIGGVINVMNGRIPTERFDGTIPSGRFSFTGGSADNLLSESGAITWGAGPLVFELDGFHRETDDVEIPGYARSAELRKDDPLPAGEKEARGTLPNSASESSGGGVGASYIFKKGHIGLSYSGIDSDYGTVAEEDVTIDLRQRRWDLQAAAYEVTPWIKELNLKFGATDYDHTEFEGPDVGTEFETNGYNGRFELIHEKIGLMEGAIGYETLHTEFSALGDEAFLPPVDTQVNSLFFFEEIPCDKFRFQFGARYDHQSNDSETNPNFGPGIDREFNGFSASAGVVYNPTEEYAVTLSASYTQRPPTYVELFADGPHVATGTFEIGDPNLDTEDSVALDFSIRKRSGWLTGSLNGFYYRFDGYIANLPTGNFEPEDNFPIYNYRAVDADFYGGEVETVFHLLEPVVAVPADAKADIPETLGIDRALDLVLRADYVHAEDRNNGESIPRIPPFRFISALDYSEGPFSARLEGIWAAAQDRNADFELPTDGYFLLNAAVTYEVALGPIDTTFFVKGVNLTDEEARLSTSFLKDIAPLPGRGVVVGLSTTF